MNDVFWDYAVAQSWAFKVLLIIIVLTYIIGSIYCWDLLWFIDVINSIE